MCWEMQNYGNVDRRVSDGQNGVDVEVGVGSDEECSLMDPPGVMGSGPGRQVCGSV